MYYVLRINGLDVITGLTLEEVATAFSDLITHRRITGTVSMVWAPER